MIDTHAPPLRRRRPTSQTVARRPRASPRTAWTSEGLRRIDVVAPDAECAALLLEYARPLFPAEVVSGSSTPVVRLQPPAVPGWAIELLSLVERWLESVPLPCAKVLYGGRSHLIHAPLDLAQLVGPATADVATP